MIIFGRSSLICLTRGWSLKKLRVIMEIAEVEGDKSDK